MFYRYPLAKREYHQPSRQYASVWTIPVEQQHAQARVWDGREQQKVNTGNLVVAQFHHTTSRELARSYILTASY